MTTNTIAILSLYLEEMWMIKKEVPKANQTNQIKQAGKGDKPRHNLTKYEEGYKQIKWKSNTQSKKKKS